MNVVFLTASDIGGIGNRGIYADLLRRFRDEGHKVYVVQPFERRLGRRTELWEDNGAWFLGVRIPNLQKTNPIEKGISMLALEYLYIRAIKKYLSHVAPDLVLYTTPPITDVGAVEYLKKKYPAAMTYLLLKDIFPQNAVDLGMMSKSGFLYKLFRKKEERLYRVSDWIGCMSPANVEYVIRHNDFVDPHKVEVAPNSYELAPSKEVDRAQMRRKYGLPLDKPVFIYGGNLGKPQGIDFLIKCLDANSRRGDCHFIVVGSGTEYGKIERWIAEAKPGNVSLHAHLPKEDYDELVQSCDVGLIFLDYRFTIPNFPSRLLGYIDKKMPVVLATDPNTDMGRIAETNGFGKACLSNDVEAFTRIVDDFVSNPGQIAGMGERGHEYMKANYLVENTYGAIMQHIK